MRRQIYRSVKLEVVLVANVIEYMSAESHVRVVNNAAGIVQKIVYVGNWLCWAVFVVSSKTRSAMQRTEENAKVKSCNILWLRCHYDVTVGSCLFVVRGPADRHMLRPAIPCDWHVLETYVWVARSCQVISYIDLRRHASSSYFTVGVGLCHVCDHQKWLLMKILTKHNLRREDRSMTEKRYTSRLILNGICVTVCNLYYSTIRVAACEKNLHNSEKPVCLLWEA